MERKTILYIFGAVLFLGIFHFFLLSPPTNFPINQTVEIEKGASLRKVSAVLEENKVIRSRVAFEFFIILMGAELKIKPAFYSFDQKLPVFAVAWRLGGGKFGMAPVVVTIPEGYNNEEIAKAFEKKLPNFNQERFLILAKEKEGYLFPDTYFFLNTDGETEATRSLSENFDKKIEPLAGEIASSGKTLKQIITMASIIEGEASGDADRALISGILWKRFKIGMALQADAAPVTYKERGLPAGPISNPGLKAIQAAIQPELSPYLYYLHDKDGGIHYAKDFATHTANKKKYLSGN
ncbi:MAG: endolytic transglycosylase MltG [Candidatus Paceibacterota bacterium]|jgi:UPF0755 protein